MQVLPLQYFRKDPSGSFRRTDCELILRFQVQSLAQEEKENSLWTIPGKREVKRKIILPGHLKQS